MVGAGISRVFIDGIGLVIQLHYYLDVGTRSLPFWVTFACEERRKGRALTRCLRHSFVSSITRQFQRLSFVISAVDLCMSVYSRGLNRDLLFYAEYIYCVTLRH
ncbi:hypothetical protein DINM_004183 [Dirofilaria immitis]|nr:hypothetical protein [Dirofilaria immitis]